MRESNASKSPTISRSSVRISTVAVTLVPSAATVPRRTRGRPVDARAQDQEREHGEHRGQPHVEISRRAHVKGSGQVNDRRAEKWNDREESLVEILPFELLLEPRHDSDTERDHQSELQISSRARARYRRPRSAPHRWPP
jgi:hypothetical protein